MNTLTPREAALIAAGVYELREQGISAIRNEVGCEGTFTTTASSRFTGTSGAFFRSESGFGYLAEGEGRFRGELLCALRGTAALADGLTDANIGVKRGPSGSYVHAGFADTWNSFGSAIESYMRKRNPARVHCVGHSLGGALAMLAADYFSMLRLPVSVYTFGAPRVGSMPFADALTHRVGEAGFFRVSHVADPVPMVPVFPFLHAPLTSAGLTIGVGSFGAPVSISAHSMVSSYGDSVASLSWADLARPASVFSDQEVVDWMNATSAGERVMVGSAWALRSIGMVINWIFRKALQSALILPSAGVSATFTLLDRIAWALQQVAKISVQMSTYVAAVIRAILRFLGRVATTSQNMTTQFLRWALDLLLAKVGNVALAALRRL